MSKVARSADLRMFEGARHPGDVCFAPTGVERRCESFEETEQSGSHMVSKGTFDTYLSICIKLDNHNNFQKILYPLLVKKVLDTAYILVV